MAWVETSSLSFAARHESAQAEAAAQVLDELEAFRESLRGLFDSTPGRGCGGHPPPPADARARPSVAAAGPAGRRPGQPPLFRRLVRQRGDPRARPARARAPVVGRRGLTRGAAPDAAARVLAPRDRRAEPRPPAPVHARHLPPLHAPGVAVRGRGHLAQRPDRPPPRGDRAPAARGRPARSSRPPPATPSCSAAPCSRCSRRSRDRRPRSSWPPRARRCATGRRSSAPSGARRRRSSATGASYLESLGAGG